MSSLGCRVRGIGPFAQIHQVHAVPLLDSKFCRQLVCHIIEDAVEVAFDRGRYIVGEVAEEGADGGGCRCRVGATRLCWDEIVTESRCVELLLG